MTSTTLELLHTARVVRKQLKASRLYSGASIRDAVELAADNLRHLADEAEFNRRYDEFESLNAAYAAGFAR